MGMYDQSRLVWLLGMPERTKIDLPLLIVAFLIVFFTAIAIAFIWGITMLIGCILIAYAGITITIGKGEKLDYTVALFIGLGVIFILLNTLGITFGVIDFSEYYIPTQIHNFVQSIIS